MPVLLCHGPERSIRFWFTVLLGSHLLSSLLITAVEQDSVPIQDPYELCRNPYQELKNLSLVGFELREYTKPVNQVSQRSPAAGHGQYLGFLHVRGADQKRQVACSGMRAHQSWCSGC